MTLYQEMPKETILSELRARFNPEEFDVLRGSIYRLLDNCHTLDELYLKAYEVLKSKRELQEYKSIHQDNFMSM